MHLPFEELESILQALISNGLQLVGKTQQKLNFLYLGKLRKKDKAFPTQAQEGTKQQVTGLETECREGWVCICVCKTTIPVCSEQAEVGTQDRQHRAICSHHLRQLSQGLQEQLAGL